MIYFPAYLHQQPSWTQNIRMDKFQLALKTNPLQEIKWKQSPNELAETELTFYSKDLVVLFCIVILHQPFQTLLIPCHCRQVEHKVLNIHTLSGFQRIIACKFMVSINI